MDNETRQLIIAGFEALGLKVESETSYLLKTTYKVTKPKKTRTQKEVTYSDEFEQAWKLYPKKQGNKKAAAYQAWCKRLEGAGRTIHAYEKLMTKGTKRYAAYHKALETPEQYINQGSTFYGRERLYMQDWTIPKQRLTKDQKKLEPWANPPHKGDYNAWVAFSKLHDYHVSPNGKEFLDFKTEVMALIKRRIEE